MRRLNITLPEELAERIADKPNKSRFIAEALEEKLEREEKQELDRLLYEGYNKTAQEDEILIQDQDDIAVEEWL